MVRSEHARTKDHLVRHQRPLLLALLLVLASACQPSVEERQGVDNVTARASRDLLAAHVQTLAGEIGERNVFLPAALQAAADYIESEWRRQGYEVERQWYETYGVDCANLEVTRTGTVAPKEILLIGAHYDSVKGSPGANDNGTGVAALLELSRMFIEVEPEISVRFVAFVNEEPPFFYWNNMGSMVYAKAAKERGDRIRGMVSIETVGYYSEEPGSQRYPPLFRLFFPDRGNFIGLVSNFRSRSWLKQTVEAFKTHSDIPTQHVAMFEAVPGIGWSDHLSFWRQGWPALMITDTAPYRYPYYHTAEDTPDKVVYETLTRLTEGLFGTFVTLAGSDLSK